MGPADCGHEGRSRRLTMEIANTGRPVDRLPTGGLAEQPAPGESGQELASTGARRA